MIRKNKKLQNSFNNINKHIDSMTLSDDEKCHLKALLLNLIIRTGEV